MKKTEPSVFYIENEPLSITTSTTLLKVEVQNNPKWRNHEKDWQKS